MGSLCFVSNSFLSMHMTITTTTTTDMTYIVSCNVMWSFHLHDHLVVPFVPLLPKLWKKRGNDPLTLEVEFWPNTSSLIAIPKGSSSSYDWTLYHMGGEERRGVILRRRLLLLFLEPYYGAPLLSFSILDR
jgi:hypothetical protein